MKAAFYAGALWLIYIYAGYPLALAIMAFWRRVRPVFSEEKIPSVSVLIAARNEEKDIGWKLIETLAWDYPAEKSEVLVASDASDDATDEIVCRFADPRLKFIRMERRGGKVRALNRLAEIASGEILFFTDANAHIGPHALRLMVRHFADPRVGCVTGDSRSVKEQENPAVSSIASLYRNYESVLRRLENTIGSVLVCDGAIFCMRSALYRRLSPDLANDVEIPMRVAAAGYYVTSEPRALVFERDTSSPLEEFRRQRRMCAQGMLALLKLRGVFRGIRGWQFASHKLLRWLSLIPMASVLVSSVVLARDSVLFASMLGLQMIFYGIAAISLAKAIGRCRVAHLLSVPFYIMLGLAAAQTGVIEALLGRRFDIWEIPTLSRGPTEAVFSSTQRID